MKNTKRAGTNGGYDITVTGWWPRNEGTAQVTLELRIQPNLIIRQCTLHEEHGHRWVTLPNEVVNQDGTTDYFPVIDFPSRRETKFFQAAALEAVDRYLGAHGDE